MKPRTPVFVFSSAWVPGGVKYSLSINWPGYTDKAGYDVCVWESCKVVRSFEEINLMDELECMEGLLKRCLVGIQGVRNRL